MYNTFAFLCRCWIIDMDEESVLHELRGTYLATTCTTQPSTPNALYGRAALRCRLTGPSIALFYHHLTSRAAYRPTFLLEHGVHETSITSIHYKNAVETRAIQSLRSKEYMLYCFFRKVQTLACILPITAIGSWLSRAWRAVLVI